jgi:UrcA family protein
MIAQTIPTRFLEFDTAVRAAALIAVCLAMPLTAWGQRPSAATPPSPTKVLMAGLDLTTQQGLAAARNRLHEAARQSCSQIIGNREPPDPANFLSCVDDRLRSELQQINRETRAAIVAQGSAWPTTEAEIPRQPHETSYGTSVIVISIADLNISSAQDALIAQERIRATARRICGQLTGIQDPASIYAKCVNDATAGALPQIKETVLVTN